MCIAQIKLFIVNIYENGEYNYINIGFDDF